MSVRVSLPTCLETFLDDKARRFMDTINRRDRRRMVECPLLGSSSLAPVLKQQLEVEVPRVRLGLPRLYDFHRPRTHGDRRKSGRRTKALLRAAAGGIDA